MRFTDMSAEGKECLMNDFNQKEMADQFNKELCPMLDRIFDRIEKTGFLNKYIENETETIDYMHMFQDIATRVGFGYADAICAVRSITQDIVEQGGRDAYINNISDSPRLHL